MTNILFIGDIFASPGRTIVARHLKDIVAAEHIDLTIANAENAAGADKILADLAENVKVRFVDFHAEVSSEKVAMGWYLDGRVSGVVGTHTHVPTADTRILPNGTAYQTDAGMTGPYNSVIGVDKQIILERFLTQMPVRMEAARHGAELHAVVVEVDDNTGRAAAVRRVTIT